jgi:hypothetical protein
MSEIDTSNAPKKDDPFKPVILHNFDTLDKDPEPVRSGQFMYFGDGLTYSPGGSFTDYHRRADIATVKRALTTKQVPIAGLSKPQQKQWWNAQVKLRGLVCESWNPNNCIKVLTTALAGGKDETPEFIEKLEKEFIEKYAQKKAELDEKRRTMGASRDEQYNRVSRDRDKVYTDPARFFAECQGKVTVVRGVSKDSHAGRVAWDLKLNFEFIYDTVYPQWIMIIGNVEDVKVEVDRINRDIEERRKEAERKAAEARRQEEEDRRRAEEAKIQNRKDRTVHHAELVRNGGGGDITGRWYLELPEFDAKRDAGEIGFEVGDHDMDIAPHQPGDAFRWATFHLSGDHGWLRIRLPEQQSEWKDKEMTFGWQLVYDEMDGGEVHNEIPNTGVITFDSASTCSGTLVGWCGGPFSFKGFKESVESSADPKHCKGGYNQWRKYEYEWRKEEECYDLTEYDSLLEEDGSGEDDEEEDEED